MGNCYLCKCYPGTDSKPAVVTNVMDQTDGSIRLLKMAPRLYEKIIAFSKVEHEKTYRPPCKLVRWLFRLIGRHQPDASLFLVRNGQFYRQCRYCDRAIQKVGGHWSVT